METIIPLTPSNISDLIPSISHATNLVVKRRRNALFKNSITFVNACLKKNRDRNFTVFKNFKILQSSSNRLSPVLVT